ncbi:MFS transporter [Actinomadura sp. KC345]|uniref:MFS transporter n=1 Tax=Actinomadura sp. KC345 TaxID=2530371 RepID=UPI0010531850|nr:MFS transporter [Actinomadura sp. KC345]TDC58735.1 MFS transporter [Actinomadura sp. KC345]
MPDVHPRRWLILGALCLGMLVIGIDNMILTLAIPALMRDVGASPAAVQWILDAYILVYAGLVLTAGSLSDRLGRKRFLLLGLGSLGFGSLLATFAAEPWQLVVCRAVMGAGAALAMPSTLSIMISIFGADERRKAMAIWQAVNMLGLVAGPMLGGLLLEYFWWGAAFFINVPLALVGILVVALVAPESRGPARPMDVPGVVLSIAGMTTLIWALISLPHEGWSVTVVAALVAAGVVLAVFAWWETHRVYPLLPLTVFKDRDFSGAALAMVLVVFTNGAVQLALTQFLQGVLGYGAVTAAFALAPLALTIAVGNLLGIRLVGHIGNKPLIVTGLLTLAVAFAVLGMIRADDGYLLVALGLGLMGLGTSLAQPAMYAVLLSAIPPKHAGVGSGVLDTLKQGGMALGVAALGSVLSTAYTANLPGDVRGAPRSSLTAALDQAGRTGSAELAAQARAAFTASMSTVFVIACLLTIAGAISALVILRGASRPGGGDGEPRDQKGRPSAAPLSSARPRAG